MSNIYMGVRIAVLKNFQNFSCCCFTVFEGQESIRETSRIVRHVFNTLYMFFMGTEFIRSRMSM